MIRNDITPKTSGLLTASGSGIDEGLNSKYDIRISVSNQKEPYQVRSGSILQKNVKMSRMDVNNDDIIPEDDTINSPKLSSDYVSPALESNQEHVEQIS